MNVTRLVFWASTALLALFLIGSGIGDIMLAEQIVQGMVHLGIPPYLLPFFGVLKLLGIITILTPALVRLREGAYAGMLFYALGAIYVHIAAGDAATQSAGGAIMLVLVLTSYLSSVKYRGR